MVFCSVLVFPKGFYFRCRSQNTSIARGSALKSECVGRDAEVVILTSKSQPNFHKRLKLLVQTICRHLWELDL